MMILPIRFLMSKRGSRQPVTQAGFVLPTAIFLVVILAALGGYMVTLARTSHVSSGLDVQGSRAYQAARAGIEWAAWQVAANPTPSCVASTTLVMPAAPPNVLAPFNVVVRCVPFGPIIDGTNTITVYQVTSTATLGAANSVDYVERQIHGSFSR